MHLGYFTNCNEAFSISYFASFLVALSPLALAPVGSTTEILTASAEVRSTAAESISTLLVHDRAASFALSRDTLLGCRLRRLVLVVALSEACLTPVSAVD